SLTILPLRVPNSEQGVNPNCNRPLPGLRDLLTRPSAAVRSRKRIGRTGQRRFCDRECSEFRTTVAQQDRRIGSCPSYLVVCSARSEERRVGKECRCRCAP